MVRVNLPSFPGCLFVLLLVVVLFACGDSDEPVSYPFEEISTASSGINFVNTVENTEDFNIFLYRNFYNGGGAGVGDINNDGLPDIYFTANMGENKLYLNKGNLQFDDITKKAGVAAADKWSTGVTFVDINADGWLDIYVCNAGHQKGKDQRNELFINNKDLTFTESAAAYGLDENGYTTHAAFFDYDKDGDLDAYILNNSFMPVNTLNYSNKRELAADDWPVKDFLKGGGDRLLRNDGGKFVDVTRASGIYNSLIGFGLGISVADVNGDGWDDLYISNDFFERDYLYINQQNGSFREEVKDRMNHLSAFSMGSDVADVNNDFSPDFFVTDMLPSDPVRIKTTSSFDDYNVYQLKLDRDFYHQYMHNTFQLNTGDGSFSEIAHYSGVAASDWSWGALILDINNDALKDIYVCNGIYHDVTNQDFIDFFANDAILRMALSGKKIEIDNIISKMPSVPLRNKVFLNLGDLTFKDASEVEVNTPSFSNGAAYGDLDNDGDLDLIINNVNQPAFLLKNLTSEKLKKNFLKVRLSGTDMNRFAIGARVYLYSDRNQMLSCMPSRGFQSSVDYTLHFGLDTIRSIDSIKVVWPDLSEQVIYKPQVNTTISVTDNTGNPKQEIHSVTQQQLLTEIENPFEAHDEDNFFDYVNEGLVIKMLSRDGPKAAVGDVNGDGRDDVYIGGARNQDGKLYLQTAEGFKMSLQPQFLRDSVFEDTACKFFDADGDGDLDLIVGSGGNYVGQGVRELQDRLYLNDGAGNFLLKGDALPNNGYNTACVVPFDMDQDGDLDLFVGSRSVPLNYGLTPKHFLYENIGDSKFKNVIRDAGTSLNSLGMVTDATLSDVDGDGKHELIVVGEWMSPRVFKPAKGIFEEVATDLSAYKGWWSSVASRDLDGDGDDDLVLGNRGENFYFSASPEEPAKLWIYDFDDNNTIEKIITTRENGKDFPVHLKKELTQQIISLKKQNLKYSEFATKSIDELFDKKSLAEAQVLEANEFRSMVALNNGNGKYNVSPLPIEAQLSCVNAIVLQDINGDGYDDLILGGNRSGFLPQFSRLDASYGNVLMNDGTGKFTDVGIRKSGLKVRGDVTELASIRIDQVPHLLFLINDSKPKFFALGRKAKEL